MTELAKAHIQGYSRKDGVYVKPHERQDTGNTLSEQHVVQHHPRLSEKGKKVVIHEPSHPSAPSTWHNPKAVATFVPNGDVPLSINGIPLNKWKDHPRTLDGWNYCDGVNHAMHEPEFHLPPGKRAASGVIVEESDGRVWVIHPTNKFGGYHSSFPKGSAEPGLSLQANAVKECFEESGLKVEITGIIGDYDRTTSVARMYRARRVGGDPTQTGWESQAVSLIPKDKLYEHLNMWPDHPIAETIGAGKAPDKKDN